VHLALTIDHGVRYLDLIFRKDPVLGVLLRNGPLLGFHVVEQLGFLGPYHLRV